MSIREIQKIDSTKDLKTLEEFKGLHPKLFNTDAKITAYLIYNITQSDSTGSRDVFYNPPISEISIFHPFIFDNRLIPLEYKNSIIKNLIIDEYPKHFNTENEKSLKKVFHPNNYIKFVKENIEEIRQKLNDKKLSELDALDALVEKGSFSDHILWWSNLKF